MKLNWSELVGSLYAKIDRIMTMHRHPIVVVCGDGGMGKTRLCTDLKEKSGRGAVILSVDGYMPSRNDRRLLQSSAAKGDELVDYDKIEELLRCFKRGERLPPLSDYDHSNGVIIPRPVHGDDVDLLLVDGSLAGYYCSPALVDLTFLFDADHETRFRFREAADSLRGYSSAEFRVNWKEYQRIYLKHSDVQRERANCLIRVVSSDLFVLHEVVPNLPYNDE